MSNNWYASAPYLMPLGNNPPNPATVMAATGQKAFQLAFILSGGGCSAAWDGTDPVSSDTQVAGVINDDPRRPAAMYRSRSAATAGTKLGQACSDTASTAAAYQAVVTKYGLKAIDFDLEEPEYEDTAAIGRELGAAKTLQQNNPGIFISITMPGTSAGTGWFGTQLIDQAKSLGFTPNNYSIMPFDGGFNGGSSQVSALEALHGLLMSHLGWDSATAYAHEGFSGMNGKSDSSEMFYQADFQTVLNYATSHGLGRFTFWSVNRDRPVHVPAPTTGSAAMSARTTGISPSSRRSSPVRRRRRATRRPARRRRIRAGPARPGRGTPALPTPAARS